MLELSFLCLSKLLETISAGGQIEPATSSVVDTVHDAPSPAYPKAFCRQLSPVLNGKGERERGM